VIGSVAAGAIGGIGGHGGGGSASGEQQTIFAEQQNYEQQLEKLIADPSSVTKLPGYEFQLGQGTTAVARQMAGSGYLGSGNEAAALTQYGQGLAQNFYTTQANLLAQLAGITAPSSPAQLGAVATQQQSNQWQQMFAAMGGLGTLAGHFGSAGGMPPGSTAPPTTPAPAPGGGGGGGGGVFGGGAG
jgi:hypothetical protein